MRREESARGWRGIRFPRCSSPVEPHGPPSPVPAHEGPAGDVGPMTEDGRRFSFADGTRRVTSDGAHRQAWKVCYAAGGSLPGACDLLTGSVSRRHRGNDNRGSRRTVESVASPLWRLSVTYAEEERRRKAPADLRRKALVEAGRAVPACRRIQVEIHRIAPWATCREHRYDNLIALCPNCHRRADRGERQCTRPLPAQAQIEADAVFGLGFRCVGPGG